ncbi:DUF1800 domain-containing protein [Puia dinghuensis]|uniref:DUF1800 domain-containing protein n=1 Tax=Puia dinghuensis TaxID=1792502 RepID=A0A8J2U820_9BACT|nr:DUF1800 domain-containing protein [Puia dinghuensis]GGA85558.1 hypothetical protein GCM10011511_05710 [Puia dinghuensis]
MNKLPGSPLGLTEYTGVWDTPQVAHLLKRTLFGATVQDIGYFKNLTMPAAVDQLLQPTAPPVAKPLNNYGSDATGVASYQTWIGTGLLYQDDTMNTNRLRSLQAWWVGNLLNCGRSIHEKMTLFWHNHFAMDALAHVSDIPCELWYNQYLTLRQYALGNFTQMVKAITIDPAMLIFLNGNTNTMTAPNENYGRELQELYTIGKGSGSAYIQDDVHTAARVLTGHTVDVNFNYTFQAGNHDTTNKTFSAFYGNTVITGYSGAPGAGELDTLLAMLFATQESAKFICRKLYNWFVYYVIDDTVENNIITPLADIFRQSNYNITTVLSTLFKSQHFYDLVNSGACIIKSPLDLLAGLAREYKLTVPTDPKGQYNVWSMLSTRSASLQQELMVIDLVAGWDAYREAPQYHELWINSVTYSERNFYTDLLIGTGDMMNGTTLRIDAVGFAGTLPAPQDPNKLITDSLAVLLRPPLSDSSITLIKQSILLGGLTNDLYWTNAWLNYVATPTDMSAFTTVDTKLRALYKYIMDLPEYHLS